MTSQPVAILDRGFGSNPRTECDRNLQFKTDVGFHRLPDFHRSNHRAKSWKGNDRAVVLISKIWRGILIKMDRKGRRRKEAVRVQPCKLNLFAAISLLSSSGWNVTLKLDEWKWKCMRVIHLVGNLAETRLWMELKIFLVNLFRLIISNNLYSSNGIWAEAFTQNRFFPPPPFGWRENRVCSRSMRVHAADLLGRTSPKYSAMLLSSPFHTLDSLSSRNNYTHTGVFKEILSFHTLLSRVWKYSSFYPFAAEEGFRERKWCSGKWLDVPTNRRTQDFCFIILETRGT